MELFDRKKSQKEKKRLEMNLKVKEVPSFIVTSRFLKLIPDSFQKEQIVEKLITLNFTEEQYNKFIKVFQRKPKFALALLDFYEINISNFHLNQLFMNNLAKTFRPKTLLNWLR